MAQLNLRLALPALDLRPASIVSTTLATRWMISFAYLTPHSSVLTTFYTATHHPSFTWDHAGSSALVIAKMAIV